jgi:hypothetical protein
LAPQHWAGCHFPQTSAKQMQFSGQEIEGIMLTTQFEKLQQNNQSQFKLPKLR